MRPDEHKKKRSAQYQKKQGGSGTKGGKPDNEKSSSNAKPGKIGGAKAEKTPQTRHKSQTGKFDYSLSASDSEDDGLASVTSNTFRRREIASNWAKYDLPPVEADGASLTPKGQDFSKVLQNAGSAVSHFRFKDEERWEGEGDSDGASGQHALSLDCSLLADSLDCLPLYTQLHLDTDIFGLEQVAAMDGKADQQRAVCGLPSLEEEKERDKIRDSELLFLDQDRTGSPETLPPLGQDKTENSALASFEKDTSLSSSLPPIYKDTSESSSLPQSSACQSEPSAGQLNAKTANSCQPSSSAAADADATATSKTNVPKDTSPPGTAAESAELEDWLDSVLDS